MAQVKTQCNVVQEASDNVAQEKSCAKLWQASGNIAQEKKTGNVVWTISGHSVYI